MNPNELMLGDWILFGDKPVQVTSDLFLPGHFTSSYKPIPLTEDIMDKNGWSLSIHMHDTHYFNSDVPFDVLVSGGECADFMYADRTHDITMLRIKYVHELQHALRLCGIEKEVVC